MTNIGEICTIVWFVIVAVFCIAGLIGVVRRIVQTEKSAEEFKHIADSGAIDSEEFPIVEE